MISFLRPECLNPITNVATVAADVDKNRVLCRVSMEVLKDQFGASEEAPMQYVALHRTTIHKAARRLIENGSFEKDGSIVIRACDFS